MAWEPGTLSLALLAIGAVNLGIAWVALGRRDVSGARPFAVMMAAVSLYAIGHAIVVGSTTLGTYRLGLRVEYVGFLGIAPAFLVFAVVFSGRDSWLTRRRVAALVVEPVVIYALVLTAPMHDLLWTIEGIVQTRPVTVVEQSLHPLFWVNVTYQYAVVIPGIVLVGALALARQQQYREQAILLLIGSGVPLAASLGWVAGLGPLSRIDPTPYSFTVTGLCYGLAVFRFGLLDLVPVARHTLVEETDDPVVVVDGEDRVVTVNPAAERLLDVDESAIGEPASSVVPSFSAIADRDGNGAPSGRATGDGSADDGSADDGPADPESGFDAGSGGEVVVVPGESDGDASDTDRRFDANVTTLTDRAGHEVGRVIIYRDVTERHAVKQRFQRLIERSSDVVSVLDDAGVHTYVSPSVENVLGYEPPDLLGDPIYEYVHPEDRDRIAAEFAAHVDDYGYTNTYVARYRHADGDWRVIEARATNLLDDPYVEGIVINGRDVTERRQRERQLEAQNERLEEFADVVSHDLRNPLTVLSGQLELARRGLESDHPSVDHLDDAADSVERMESILEDLRRLAEQGQAVEDPDPVDLDDLARRAWANVPTADAELDVETDATVPADEGLLCEALENLFRNAVEHAAADDGGVGGVVAGQADGDAGGVADGHGSAGGTDPSVTVTVGDRTDGFYVADDGRGFPDDAEEDLFGYGVSTEEGTGLGLAIVERIVSAHGWTIEATESESGGARFDVTGV